MLNIFIFVFYLSQSAHAFFMEANLFYSSDALSKGTSNTVTRTLYDFAFGFNVDRKGQMQAGWGYHGMSSSDVDGSTSKTTTFSGYGMGPKFNFFLDRKRRWCLGLTYGIVARSTYKDTNSSEESWRGSTYKGDFGYIYRLDNGAFFFGARLNYVSGSYNEKLVDQVTFSNVSNSRTFMYPSFTLGLDF